MQARYDDPVIGRFLSTDLIGYQDQINLYAYVGGDPLNRIDPTGESDEFSCNQFQCEIWQDPAEPGSSGDRTTIIVRHIYPSHQDRSRRDLKGSLSAGTLSGRDFMTAFKAAHEEVGLSAPSIEIVSVPSFQDPAWTSMAREPMRPGTRPNDRQNKQAEDARRQAERNLQQKMTRAQQRTFHELITKQGIDDYHELVEIAEDVINGAR